MKVTSPPTRSGTATGPRSRVLPYAFTLLSVVLLLAGCSGASQNGLPIAVPPASTTTSAATDQQGPTSITSSTDTSTNRYGAPKVRVPLDATRFLSNPCAALTEQQLPGLNVNPPGNKGTNAVPNASGPGCVWSRSSAVNFLGVAFMVGNKNGLADLYRAHQSGDFRGYWIETTVDDYPAVFENATDDRADGVCDIAVGISETLAFRVNMQTRNGPKPCDTVKLAASYVRANLQKND
jgi:hypothetical protein